MADTRADGQERTTHRRPETGWPIAAGGERGNCHTGMRSEFAVCQPVSCLIFRSTDLGSASINLYIYICTFLGWLSDPFKGLSDLQLGDEKGTLNHLVYNIYIYRKIHFVLQSLPCSELVF